MSISTQVPKITQFSGQIPDRKNMDKDTFANSIPPYLNYFNNNFTPETNNLVDKLNQLSNDINATVNDINNVQNDIHTVANTAFDLDKFKGEWDSTTSYIHPCMVRYKDLLWVSLQDSTGKEPDISPDYWFKLADKAYKYINSDYTASRNDFLLIDTTNNIVNVTLPTSSTNFNEVFFVDIKGQFDTNKLVIKRGNTDDTIMGLSEDMDVDTKNISFGLIYYSGDWRII